MLENQLLEKANSDLSLSLETLKKEFNDL